jgi:hypothetical protein
MVHEVARLGPAPATRRVLLKPVQITTQDSLDLRTGAVGVQDAHHVTDDLQMAAGAVGLGPHPLQGREGRP